MPFTDGQPIHTAIFIDVSTEGYLRKDYSIEGWEQRPEPEQNPFSSWMSKWKAPEHNQEELPLEKDTAETLLDRLTAEDDPLTENTRYILALMLERARLLEEIEHTKLPDHTLRVYKHKKTETAYLISDPELPLDQITSLQMEVAEKLGDL